MKRLIFLAAWLPIAANSQTFTPSIDDGALPYTRWVIEPKYNYGSPFFDGVAYVTMDGRQFYIDKTGKEVPEPAHTDWEWGDGLQSVSENGKYGFRDANGLEVIPIIYDYAKPFSGGQAAVKINGIDTGIYGYIDKTGKMIVEPRFKMIYHLYSFAADGLEWADEVGEDDDYTFGFIDRNGDWVASNKLFDDVGWLADGLIQVKVAGKYGYANRAGKIVVQPRPMPTWPEPFREGLAWVVRGDKYGIHRLVTVQEYITQYVSANLDRWQDKDEYESTAEYNARIDPAARARMIDNLCDWFQAKYAASFMFANETARARHRGYDADQQTVLVTLPTLGDLVFKMPGAVQARALRDNWEQVSFADARFMAVRGADGEARIILASITMIDGETGARYLWNVSNSHPFRDLPTPPTYKNISWVEMFS